MQNIIQGNKRDKRAKNLGGNRPKFSDEIEFLTHFFTTGNNINKNLLTNKIFSAFFTLIYQIQLFSNHKIYINYEFRLFKVILVVLFIF